ncbi:putative ATP-dependent RNA helicase [Trypanosoma cruzi]|uniref:Putative ATP-dependent RNA helicase n=1 Tax=Trypanosoma cruzi TaxID=5693 RepID=A0A2V2VKB3_TRYCR|nr:putative ATP-dependent RNA helicase [Trypanosoma cruzi]
MAAMNKPMYNAICEKSPNKPVIVFVSSRRQTRLTAMALIGFLLMEQNTAKFVRMDVDEVTALTEKVSDPYVKHCMQFGVGIHHAGLLGEDRTVVENAFLAGKLQILVATSTLAWGVNFSRTHGGGEGHGVLRWKDQKLRGLPHHRRAADGWSGGSSAVRYRRGCTGVVPRAQKGFLPQVSLRSLSS